MKLILCAVLLGGFQLCAGAKILTLVPTPARSHHNLLERLALKLAATGHDVTFITAYKQPKPVPNLKEIILPDFYKEMAKIIQPGKNNTDNMFELRHMPKWFMVTIFPSTGPILTDMVLSYKQMQDLLNSNERFDLIIGEVFLDESLLAGLSYKYKAPIIGVATFMPNFWVNHLLGNPAPMSYVPNSLLGYYNRMTFCERLENALYSVLEEVNYRFFTLRNHDKTMRKHFGNDLPPLDDIIKNTSLVLVNHHYSLAFPRPYLPNMVEIGGYHVNPPKPLPPNLQKYFDESKHGVILFSMGSHLKSAQLPLEKKNSILKAFARLKQDVLWKFEDDTLTNLPKNVRIEKWLPQSDILAHPNLKLFITHGGLLSTTEAVTRGVPIVGIPVMGDQPLNMKYNTAAGFGVSVDFDDLNEDTLFNAITEILNNPKYKENAKLGSKLIQDTPLPALDTAMYWIEYVLRHKGAPHLRSAAQDLAWYELYLLDVLGAIFIIVTLSVLLLLAVTKFLLKRILGLCFKKSSKTSSTKKKN